MGVITSTRHTKADLQQWARWERYDRYLMNSRDLERREERAEQMIREFFAHDKSGYCGVSWGKDSVVVAHLIRRVMPDIPLVWIRPEPIYNPHCPKVRNIFLEQYPGPYFEFIEKCHPTETWWVSDAEGQGFAPAIKQFGPRHVSGVRGEEATVRQMRMMKHGENTKNTSAPIGWWSGTHVFAYLHKYDLPIHPAYAMTWGGALDRIRVRVSSLRKGGGGKGDGRERGQWESTYYRKEYAVLAGQARIHAKNSH